ncbi:hypothetical protein PIB30_032805 [Stylosanthes scabra]|uniref:THO complex subunit 5B n=1 Tax=Stylosanthes scabra TaxID=79078 RepID=A0ABU6XA38_9FABA|nr:hypothetical protein [Stylosanthes scabra]
MEDGEIEEVSVHAAEEDDQGFSHSSQNRSPEESPNEILQNSKASVENIVAEILSIKKHAKSKQLLRELVTQMFLHFVTLRQEEFFRDAPKDIKDSVLSNDAAHNLMLQRLNFELFQRKELCKLHEKLEQKKKSLLVTIANRKKFLTSLPSHLKSLKKASLPVQNQLGVLHTKKLKQHHSAELLPPSLYVIYSQLLAQKEAFGESIDLEIIGSLKDAQAFARQQAHKDTGISSTTESSKLEDDALDEEEDGQRRRKRPRRVQGKESLDQAGIFQAHPLKVIIHVYDDEASDPKSARLITLKFEYLVKLNIVCVGIEGSNDGAENDILCNLFPDDTGLELPHQQNRVQTILQRIRSRRKAHLALLEQLESLTKLEWPFLSCKSVPWALHAPSCNLNVWSRIQALPVPCVASTPILMDKDEHVPEAMDTDIVEHFGATKEELESITEDGELPTLVPNMSLDHSKQLTLISKSVTPSLINIRSQSFKKIEDTESDIDEPAQNEQEHEDIESYHHGRKSLSWMDCGVKEFSLVLSRKLSADESNVNLEAKINISMEYPLRPPLFALSLRCLPTGENHYQNDGLEWYNELRAMEAEVNLHIVKMLPIDQQNYVLAHQVRCLAMLFDRYLDDASPSERTSSTTLVDVGLCKPVTGSFLARSFRGRDRRKMISWKDTKFTSGCP